MGGKFLNCSGISNKVFSQLPSNYFFVQELVLETCSGFIKYYYSLEDLVTKLDILEEYLGDTALSITKSGSVAKNRAILQNQ
jgi:hypothetical protein